jgi:hypothetical protein
MDHREYVEHCVEKARAAGDENDKVLWLTLAASWLRLAEHAAGAVGEHRPNEGENALAAHAAD